MYWILGAIVFYLFAAMAVWAMCKAGAEADRATEDLFEKEIARKAKEQSV